MGLAVNRAEWGTTIALDWPERRNALRIEDMRLLRDALEGMAADGSRCLVLTGNGAFCAGADLRHVAERRVLDEASRRADVRSVVQGLVMALLDVTVPTIAAIDGPAVGLGFDLALACDMRLIGPDGWFMQGWGRVGVIPATGGELLLRQRAPGVLWPFLAEQPRVAAAEAERLGLAETAGSGLAIEAAERRAEALAALPAATVAAYLALARSDAHRDLPRHLELCAASQPALLAEDGVGQRIRGILGRDVR